MLSKINNTTCYLVLLNLLELSLIPLLIVCLVLPLTRFVENAFTIDATLLPSPYYFLCEDEIFEMMMKKNIFFLLFGMTKLF